jgi:putative transcriptional regulator
MIKCHLGRLMGERRLKVIDVARAIERHRNSIDLLYKDQAKQVDLETLSRLCKFFECKLDELLEYIPENKSKRK